MLGIETFFDETFHNRHLLLFPGAETYLEMFHIEKISSLDLPELAPYRTMRRSVEHEAQGIFIAEGEKVTRRLLESRFTVVSVVLPERHLENFPSAARSATGNGHRLCGGKIPARNLGRLLAVSRRPFGRQNSPASFAQRYFNQKPEAAITRGH